MKLDRLGKTSGHAESLRPPHDSSPARKPARCPALPPIDLGRRLPVKGLQAAARFDIGLPAAEAASKERRQWRQRDTHGQETCGVARNTTNIKRASEKIPAWTTVSRSTNGALSAQRRQTLIGRRSVTSSCCTGRHTRTRPHAANGAIARQFSQRSISSICPIARSKEPSDRPVGGSADGGGFGWGSSAERFSGVMTGEPRGFLLQDGQLPSSHRTTRVRQCRHFTMSIVCPLGAPATMLSKERTAGRASRARAKTINCYDQRPYWNVFSNGRKDDVILRSRMAIARR